MATSFDSKPRSLFLVGEMGIPIGLMMLAGTLLGIIAHASGYFFAKWVNRKWTLPLRDSQDEKPDYIKDIVAKTDAQLPPIW